MEQGGDKMPKWKGQKEWDKANQKTVSTNIKKSDADAFQDYAARHNTTKSKILSDYIKYCIRTDEPPISYD